jgi:hypothetical protein
MKILLGGIVVGTLLLMALAVPAGAEAEAPRLIEKKPFTFNSPISLCDESVLMDEGIEHSLWAATCNSAGFCSLHDMSSISGTGVGESTGMDYRYLTRSSITNTQTPHGQSRLGEQLSFMLISQGRGQKYVLHCAYHTITNAHGEETSTFLDCHRKACDNGGAPPGKGGPS